MKKLSLKVGKDFGLLSQMKTYIKEIYTLQKDILNNTPISKEIQSELIANDERFLSSEIKTDEESFECINDLMNFLKAHAPNELKAFLSLKEDMITQPCDLKKFEVHLFLQYTIKILSELKKNLNKYTYHLIIEESFNEIDTLLTHKESDCSRLIKIMCPDLTNRSLKARLRFQNFNEEEQKNYINKEFRICIVRLSEEFQFSIPLILTQENICDKKNIEEVIKSFEKIYYACYPTTTNQGNVKYLNDLKSQYIADSLEKDAENEKELIKNKKEKNKEKNKKKKVKNRKRKEKKEAKSRINIINQKEHEVNQTNTNLGTKTFMSESQEILKTAINIKQHLRSRSEKVNKTTHIEPITDLKKNLNQFSDTQFNDYNINQLSVQSQKLNQKESKEISKSELSLKEITEKLSLLTKQVSKIPELNKKLDELERRNKRFEFTVPKLKKKIFNLTKKTIALNLKESKLRKRIQNLEEHTEAFQNSLGNLKKDYCLPSLRDFFKSILYHFKIMLKIDDYTDYNTLIDKIKENINTFPVSVSEITDVLNMCINVIQGENNSFIHLNKYKQHHISFSTGVDAGESNGINPLSPTELETLLETIDNDIIISTDVTWNDSLKKSIAAIYNEFIEIYSFTNLQSFINSVHDSDFQINKKSKSS